MIYTNPKELSFITYPWCYKNDVFNAEELKKIIDYCNTIEKIEGTIKVKGKIDTTESDFAKIETFRNSKISWISRNEESAWFFDKLAENIDLLNKTYYRFDFYGYSNLQFTEYVGENLGKYDYHMDTLLGIYDQNEPLTRKLSATLLLNDNFEGGNFEFFEQAHQPKMLAGSLIVFPSFMVHRVTPVTKGVRNSLVAWCVGPKFK